MDPLALNRLRGSRNSTRRNYNGRIAAAANLHNLKGPLSKFAGKNTIAARFSRFFGKKNTTRINAARNQYRQQLQRDKEVYTMRIDQQIHALEEQQRIWEEFQDRYGLETALEKGTITKELMDKYEALGYTLIREKQAHDYPGRRGPIPMPAAYAHYIYRGTDGTALARNEHEIPMTAWASTIDSVEKHLGAQNEARRKQAEWDAAKPGLIARYQALGYTYIPTVQPTYDSGHDGHGSYSILKDPGKPEYLKYKQETQMAVSGNGWRTIEKKVDAYTREYKVNVGKNQNRVTLETRREFIPAGTATVYVRDLPAGFPAVIESYDFATKIDELEALRQKNNAKPNANGSARRNAATE